MQNRYVGGIGDFVKLSILRALSSGYRLGVAWWLYPDESHDEDARHISYLQQPDLWWHFDPRLFDTLEQIIKSGQRNVRPLETANILPGAIFASEMIPVAEPTADHPHLRRQWFETVQRTLKETELVFVDPDSGLEPVGYSLDSSRAGKSILLGELRELARPGRCLIVRHHPPLRKDGGLSAMRYWADRLRKCGFATVDALRARPYSPRVFFLLDAPADIRHRAEQIAANWHGWITWHPDGAMPDRGHLPPTSGAMKASAHSGTLMPPLTRLKRQPKSRRTIGSTTEVGYINPNHQEVIRATGNPSVHHLRFVYVLWCRKCGHQYGANGCDIFQRRCPAHDDGAPGLAF